MSKSRSARGILVVGCPRSGTSLLQSLLATHSQATSFTESHFLSNHFRCFSSGRIALLVRDPRPRLDIFLAENDVVDSNSVAAQRRLDGLLRGWPLALSRLRGVKVASCMFEVLDHLAQARGKSTWIEKTPRHLHFLELAERARRGQRTQIVHLVRAPAPTITSLHSTSKHWSHPYTLAQCARRWNEDVQRTLGHAQRANHHVVSYEELVSKPHETMQSLCRRLDLSFEPNMLDDYSKQAGNVVAGGESWKEGLRRPIENRPQIAVEDLPEDTRRILRPELYRQAAALAVGVRGR